MSLASILKMSDTDVIDPTMAVGSVVVPINKDGANALVLPDNVNKNIKGVTNLSITYGFGVVVNMSPFTLVDETGAMRWQSTVAQANYKSVGTAKDDVMAICNTRLNS